MPTALGDADPDYVVCCKHCSLLLAKIPFANTLSLQVETGTIMGDFVQLESVSTMVAGMKTISGPMPTVLSVPIALSTAAAGSLLSESTCSFTDTFTLGYFGSLSSAGAATSGAVTNTYPGGEGALDSSDAGGAERMLGFGKHDKDFGSTASDGSGSKTAEPSNESKATSGSNTMTSTAASDATTSAPAATSSSSEGGGFMSNLKNIAGGGAGAAADQATSIKTGNHSTSTTSMGSKSTPPSNWDKNGTSCAKRNVTDKAPQGDDGGNGILFTKGASHGTSFGTNKASGSYPTEGAPYPIVNVRPSPSSKAHSEYPRWLPHSTLDITTAPTLSSQSWTTRVVKRDCPVGEISDGQVQVTPCDESSSAQQT